MAHFIDIHVVQTLPPSNPNRDENGTPKSAQYGGVRRMRISSQAIKRATRQDFQRKLSPNKHGVRTKLIAEAIQEKIVERNPELESIAATLAESACEALGFKLEKKAKETGSAKSKVLVFLSAKQIDNIVDVITDNIDPGLQPKDIGKRIKELELKRHVTVDHSIDIALFGRMVAGQAELNVDAACQVAHGIGVGAVDQEFDFLTGVDDRKQLNIEADAGAGMITNVEFCSATLYRYATINFDLLRENLGNDDTAHQAVELFVDSFCRSMPTGKIASFANYTLPDAVLVQIRDDQPINLVGAFETQVFADQMGFVKSTVERLVKYETDIREGLGVSPKTSLTAWTVDRAAAIGELGERVPLAELGRSVIAVLRDA